MQPAGPLLVRYPTGALKKVSYEGSLVHTRIEEPSGSPLLQRTEKRGIAGEIEWVQENDAGRTTYQYDPLGALVAIEREQEAWSWGVDAVEGPQGQLALFDETGRLREARLHPGFPLGVLQRRCCRPSWMRPVASVATR